ncbi:MAG: oligosaccharide flippase family protein [Gammaproteobacteria bacterium]|nr:oligosaccharide flippase family protein [Gammaproteobacteria bacterium]
MRPNTWIKSEYARNVLTLMSGTTIAQAIPVAITPVLTRLYSPAEFGLFAVYMALIAIGTMIATGRLEMAVLIARKDADALRLALISIAISGVFSILALCVIIIWGQQIAAASGQPEIGDWLYIVPFSIFLFSVYKVLLHWLNRKKHYELMARSRVTQSGSISVLQVIVSLGTKITPGLALADCLGRALSLVLILGRIRHTVKLPGFHRARQLALIRRYRNFPFLGSPTSLLNVLSLQLPYVIIPALFSSAVAGLYFLVFRVLMMPISVLGEAMMEVFRNKAAEDLEQHGTCRPVFIKTLSSLVIIGLPPTLLLMIFGREIFAFIFGEDWREAGLYATILAPMALFRLVCAPLGGVLFIREKLKLVLFLQSLFFLMVALSLALGWVYDDAVLMVVFLSVSGCLFYLVQALNSFRLSTIENTRAS